MRFDSSTRRPCKRTGQGVWMCMHEGISHCRRDSNNLLLVPPSYNHCNVFLVSQKEPTCMQARLCTDLAPFNTTCHAHLSPRGCLSTVWKDLQLGIRICNPPLQHRCNCLSSLAKNDLTDPRTKQTTQQECRKRTLRGFHVSGAGAYPCLQSQSL